MNIKNKWMEKPESNKKRDREGDGNERIKGVSQLLNRLIKWVLMLHKLMEER